MKRVNRSKYYVCSYFAHQDFIPFPLNSPTIVCLLVPIPAPLFETRTILIKSQRRDPVPLGWPPWSTAPE